MGVVVIDPASICCSSSINCQLISYFIVMVLSFHLVFVGPFLSFSHTTFTECNVRITKINLTSFRIRTNPITISDIGFLVNKMKL